MGHTRDRIHFSVGDIIRCYRFSGSKGVWQITAVILGALHQENIICLRVLDMTDPIGNGDMSMPEELLLLAIENGAEYMPAMGSTSYA